jgi:hypothetical protein
MRRGDFEGAWRISDEVLRGRIGKPCWDWPRHLQYVWQGQPLEQRRVLVRCYHGLGDTLQFVRFLPMLAERARSVVVWAQPALIPLLRTMQLDVEWLPLHDGVPETDYDVDVELMELPHIFRTTLGNIPASVPYLHVEPAAEVIAPPRARLEVGVVWQSGDWDTRRSIGLDAVRLWARVPGIRLHCLQRGWARAQWPAEIGPDSGSDDPLRTAQVMRALDLVITVDSMPAHLAGALAVPTWTLLHAHADWRWMERRTDSPWYPTMQLFRQPAPGEWQPALERVGFELARLARNVASGSSTPRRPRWRPGETFI